MSKQELIEKAVLHFGGKWIFPFKNLCTPAETNTFYAPHSKFESIRNVSELGANWIFICTEHEFNAAADRMRGKPDWKDAPEWAQWLGQCFSGNWEWYQKKPSADNDCFDHGTGRGCQSGARGKVIGDWRNTLEKRPEHIGGTNEKVDPLNGYKWGVEYPTNGKRPELADGTLVELTFVCGTKMDCKTSSTTFESRPIHDPVVVSFRITDQRHKPAEPEQAPAKAWFETGEFPPAGTYCQFQLTDGTGNLVNCFVVGVDDLGFCVCRSDMNYLASMSQSSFRPIKTDKEKAIDAACSTVKDGNQHLSGIFGQLYDAGLLRLPDQK